MCSFSPGFFDLTDLANIWMYGNLAYRPKLFIASTIRVDWIADESSCCLIGKCSHLF